mmetsp:Transcript_31979/g.79300  ORF Transcript_31979/g.79300 Transcript_31979/m.79300 type:complete len:217 (-) Transcript_31979:76-726(-)
MLEPAQLLLLVVEDGRELDHHVMLVRLARLTALGAVPQAPPEVVHEQCVAGGEGALALPVALLGGEMHGEEPVDGGVVGLLRQVDVARHGPEVRLPLAGELLAVPHLDDARVVGRVGGGRGEGRLHAVGVRLRYRQGVDELLSGGLVVPDETAAMAVLTQISALDFARVEPLAVVEKQCGDGMRRVGGQLVGERAGPCRLQTEVLIIVGKLKHVVL